MSTNGSVSTAGDNRKTIDTITASVIQGALESIAIEMGFKLMRMAYSSIIRESEDFGAAAAASARLRVIPTFQTWNRLPLSST